MGRGSTPRDYDNDEQYFHITGSSKNNSITVFTADIKHVVDITLDNVHIELDTNNSALNLDTSSANVKLKGSNTLISRGIANAAGIRITQGSTGGYSYYLNIEGDSEDGFDSLTVRGGTGSAGIGGINPGNPLQQYLRTAGVITIRNCMVTAVGGLEAAGIGGADEGQGGTITINGAIIDARGGRMAAGIGDGYFMKPPGPESRGAEIAIEKSIVEAFPGVFSGGRGPDNGPAILGKGIEINNSLVNAVGHFTTRGSTNPLTAGIDCGEITIDSSFVTAIGQPALRPNTVTLTATHYVKTNTAGADPGGDGKKFEEVEYENNPNNRFVSFMLEPPENAIPAPEITGAQATSSRSVTLTFTNDDDVHDIEGYFVWCENTDAMAMVESGITNPITTTITGLAPATTYRFRVAAYTADDISPPSDAWVITTPESGGGGGGCDAGFGAMALLLIAVPCAARMSKKKR